MKATVKPVQIKQRISRWGLIRYQILSWCALRGIQITNADLDMLVLLAILGKTKLSTFCEELIKTESSCGTKIKKYKGTEKEYKYIFDSCQSARNALSKMSELGLVSRKGRNKSNIQVWINPLMEIHTDANLLINYQLLCLDPTES